MLAAGSANTSVVASLLAGGADPDALNAKGETAAHYARALPNSQRNEITRLLQRAENH